MTISQLCNILYSLSLTKNKVVFPVASAVIMFSHSLIENCTKFGQLILSKIIKIVANSCQILKLECTKFDFGRALPRPPSWIEGGLLLLEGREVKGRGGRERRVRGRGLAGRGGEGKGSGGRGGEGREGRERGGLALPIETSNDTPARHLAIVNVRIG